MAFEPKKTFPSFSVIPDKNERKNVAVLTTDIVYSNDLKGFNSRVNDIIRHINETNNENELLRLKLFKLENDCKQLLKEIDVFANLKVNKEKKSQ